MELTNNTVLVTGGGSGIGRGLAETLHRCGNRVVIAGRRREVLQRVADVNPGIVTAHLDQADPESITRLAAELADQQPDLNVLINNAGVIRAEDLRDGDTSAAEEVVATNLLGPIRLTAALLPALLAQPRAALINVTSGLAFAPLASAPSYSATKAALHSYTQSLRQQLRGTSVQVIEIIPPLVATDMPAPEDPAVAAMPLNEFVAETFSLLRADPGAIEIMP